MWSRTRCQPWFFWRWLNDYCFCLWPELKQKVKKSNKLICFFLWFVSPGFCFFCVFEKKQMRDRNQFKQFVCFDQKHKKKKKKTGDRSHNVSQISFFWKLKKPFKLFDCDFKFWITINFNQRQKNKADIGSFIKFVSKLVSIVFLIVLLFSCLGYIVFWIFHFFTI